MATPIIVRGLGTVSHHSDQYVLLDLYFPGKDGRIAQITRELHLVDNLRAKMLIGADIIGPEGISINPQEGTATIYSYDNISIPITMTPKSNERIRRTVKTQTKTTIPPRTKSNIRIKRPGKLPDDRDLFFRPEYNAETERIRSAGGIYAHAVDCNVSFGQISNRSDENVVIPVNTRLGTIVEYDVDGYFLANELTGTLASAGYENTPKNARITHESTPLIRASERDITKHVDDYSNEFETKHRNGVTIFRDHRAVERLTAVVDEYADIW